MKFNTNKIIPALPYWATVGIRRGSVHRALDTGPDTSSARRASARGFQTQHVGWCFCQNLTRGRKVGLDETRERPYTSTSFSSRRRSNTLFEVTPQLPGYAYLFHVFRYQEKGYLPMFQRRGNQSLATRSTWSRIPGPANQERQDFSPKAPDHSSRLSLLRDCRCSFLPLFLITHQFYKN